MGRAAKSFSAAMDSSFTTKLAAAENIVPALPLWSSGYLQTVASFAFDDTMDALKQLDAEAAKRTDYGRLIDRARRIRDLFIVRKGMAV